MQTKASPFHLSCPARLPRTRPIKLLQYMQTLMSGGRCYASCQQAAQVICDFLESLFAGVKLKELEDALPNGDSKPAAADDYEAYSSDDENLPPLRPNTNRPIREYTYSDDESSSEDGA